jgi:hypothetical protein
MKKIIIINTEDPKNVRSFLVKEGIPFLIGQLTDPGKKKLFRDFIMAMNEPDDKGETTVED